MVVSLLPLPGQSDVKKSFDYDPSSITTEKADMFWMNYMNWYQSTERMGKGSKVGGHSWN